MAYFDLCFDKITEALMDKYCASYVIPTYPQYKREIDMYEVLNDNNETVTLGSYLEADTNEYRLNVELNYTTLVKYMLENGYIEKHFVLKTYCEYCYKKGVENKCLVSLSSVIDELKPTEALMLGLDLAEMELNYLDAYYSPYFKTVVSFDEIKYNTLVVDALINHVEKYGYRI
jgi:hypothetical protein